ncbi:MAG TPA: hypothetical protein VJ377_07795 [Dehalococcoidales bacterium]|nr:MAG: hypothetical protein A2Z05_05600 [Chloroflexi bacterium RBG_16_60_22]HJX13412.1 hypothetical protein [Dehalococcoidales bacterium]
MLNSRFRFGLLMAASLMVFLSGSGCARGPDFDDHLREVTAPYRFDVSRWEFGAFLRELGRLGRGTPGSTGNATAVVAEYFENAARVGRLEARAEAIAAGGTPGDLSAVEKELAELRERNAAMAAAVERQLEGQIREALSGQGIFNPIGGKIPFPPVNFHLGMPPHLLVISPRDRIESIRRVTLLPGMTREDMESIEAEIDRHGVSSLVVDLGGLATYPSYVTDAADLRFVLDTAHEEWLHQYLAFTPLGFLYLLDLAGIRPDYEIATMNETLASMVSKELGGLIYEQYYNGDRETPGEGTPPSGFDFNREMREIRRTVDGYLARGEIEPAERFMEMKRQYLATRGYHLRKLNQAYFAFHGTYADSPTSISPIGVEMKQLRSGSDSLRDFLDTVSVMTSRQDLAESLR